VYHTTHQCFYSRRSLYLALFRLTDGKEGIRELDPWLRNVKLRAPGSVVMVVGTHLDMMKDHQEIKRLEQCAMAEYSNSRDHPKVVGVMSVSAKQTFLSRNNNIDKLRMKLYDIACHLQVASDGVTLEYKEGCREDAPKCLFQIQIPRTFLNLQDKVRETVASYRASDKIPIMEEEEFKENFKDLFDDEEEMNEAVFYLNLQGTLLHFEDHGLKETYFLDPQWLAKLMASIIHPSAEEGKSPIKKGMGEVCDLFQGSPDRLRRKYIRLLEKFEVALQLTETQVIIPSLMPTEVNYPKPNDSLSDIEMDVDSFYQPPMRRFWLAAYIPEGFWPRLICRIATDHQIGKTLRNLIKRDPKMSSAQDSTPYYKLNWIPWRSGIAFVDHGRTLLVIRGTINEGHPPSTEDGVTPFSQVRHLKGSHRIEVHVYAPELITLVAECSGEETEDQETGIEPDSLTTMATQLLIMISKHVQTLASDWFSDMLRSEENHLPPPVYLPCWKCYGHKPFPEEDAKWDDGSWIFHDGKPVHCFTLNQSIVPAALGDDLKCPLHGKIKIVHTAPDLVFCDLKNSSTYYQDNDVPLKIHSDQVLGKGGYGFVCEGDLSFAPQNKKKVAVKVFLEDPNIENSSIDELLEKSKQAGHLLHAYREIRQEVAFLSALDHPHLTQLCGVRTRPNMCLLLELAPLGSLRQQLKDYHHHNLVLESLTLKLTTLQIANGLEFLHQHQIVHLDMKSPNVLVWYFPSADYSQKDRVNYAGNVWLKLADYGISQVSTGFVMRVRSNPVGTPGYMAPELFDQLGQQVSSEKVDVFGFGMTIYELLSLSPPFSDVYPPFKRNTEIRDRHRPLLKGRQTRSLVLLQELMRLCWEHDPDHRPRMSQIREWVAAEEFERLRADVALSDVHSISCACICRITPENEEEFMSDGLEDQEIGRVDDESRFLPSVLEDSGNVENTVNTEEYCRDESTIYQFVPSGRRSNSPGFVLDHAYSQIWMCGRDRKKGLLHIFTYYDGQPGFHSFSGYCSKEEVSALCPVKNMMWMGTTTGTIKVFHAPTLQAKFTGKLIIGASRPSCILNILHIPSMACVLVSTANGDIWSFQDRLTPKGLVKQCRLTLTDYYQCYHLVAVEREGTVEVWGTMDNSQLCLLERDGGLMWKSQEIKVNTGDPKLRLCSHIALASFVNKRGVGQNHLWISYRSRGVLVAWDANSRQQLAVINCNNSFPQLKANKDSTFQVSTLAAHGKKVFFGTDCGSVGIIDSDTHQLLRSLHWYEGKVRTLLVMPKEVESCICAEVPLPSQLQAKPENSRRQNGKKPDPFKNPHNVMSKDRNAVMVTTFGNGRKKYSVHTVTRSERNMQFDKEFLTSSLPAARRTNHFTHENISLLSWKS
jgi:serine/threonine protein kinase